jgi:hypothetical protein
MARADRTPPHVALRLDDHRHLRPFGAGARARPRVDNLANSQTVGFKRIDTNFTDLVTQSGPTLHAPGSVLALPDFTNTVQGTVEQSENPLASPSAARASSRWRRRAAP